LLEIGREFLRIIRTRTEKGLVPAEHLHHDRELAQGCHDPLRGLLVRLRV
jgi:hypothetical protein